MMRRKETNVLHHSVPHARLPASPANSGQRQNGLIRIRVTDIVDLSAAAAALHIALASDAIYFPVTAFATHEKYCP